MVKSWDGQPDNYYKRWCWWRSDGRAHLVLNGLEGDLDHVIRVFRCQSDVRIEAFTSLLVDSILGQR
jgi:hypothetical protein